MRRETAQDALRTPAYDYAYDVVHDRLVDAYGRPTKAPRYVKKQARAFLKIADGRDKAWIISEKKARQVKALLDLMIMPKGLKAGQRYSDCMVGYQWLRGRRLMHGITDGAGQTEIRAPRSGGLPQKF